MEVDLYPLDHSVTDEGNYKPISGYVRRILAAKNVLDVGFRGSQKNAAPIVPWAVGIDLGYPGYDGIHLPFDDRSQDAVFSSHCLEHIEDQESVFCDWFRVLKVGGSLVVLVPHHFLYERKAAPPSYFTGDHKRFYTPGSLISMVEKSLPVAEWRLRTLRDVDQGFNYSTPPGTHATGLCEIELVIQKIERPAYVDQLIEKPMARTSIEHFANVVLMGIEAARLGDMISLAEAQTLLKMMPLPPYRRLGLAVSGVGVAKDEIISVLLPVIVEASFDEDWYLQTYPDIAHAVSTGHLLSGRAHFASGGYFDGRLSGPPTFPYV